jgi:hypothetical protein
MVVGMGMVLDGFNDVADILKQYEEPASALDGCEVLYASYTYEDYDGRSVVLVLALFAINAGCAASAVALACNGAPWLAVVVALVGPGLQVGLRRV